MEAARSALTEQLAGQWINGLACSHDEQILHTVRSRSMNRLSVVVLCCAVYFVTFVPPQSTTSAQTTRDARDAHLRHIAEPPELAGEPGPLPFPPTRATLPFVPSKAISTANPHDPKTLAPAIRELTELIRLEPTNSDFYFLRATLSCYARANPTELRDDISHSTSLHQQSTSTAYPTLKEHYTLKAKIEFESSHF